MYHPLYNAVFVGLFLALRPVLTPAAAGPGCRMR